MGVRVDVIEELKFFLGGQDGCENEELKFFENSKKKIGGSGGSGGGSELVGWVGMGGCERNIRGRG